MQCLPEITVFHQVEEYQSLCVNRDLHIQIKTVFTRGKTLYSII